MPKISSKNQVTIPVESLRLAGLKAGDHVAVEVEDSGRIVLRRAPRGPQAGLGVFDGLYEPDYLERLRARDWD